MVTGEIHSIRLHGPWTVSSPDHARTFVHPCTWAAAGFANHTGTLSHHRSFGKPTNIEKKRLFLSLERIQESGKIFLNDELLAENFTGGRLEITGKLLPRNLLTIEVSSTSDQGGIVGGVSLEIVNS